MEQHAVAVGVQLESVTSLYSAIQGENAASLQHKNTLCSFSVLVSKCSCV
jgi:hypothetical protein